MKRPYSVAVRCANASSSVRCEPSHSVSRPAVFSQTAFTVFSAVKLTPMTPSIRCTPGSTGCTPRVASHIAP
jgi:hypothetical protein